MPNRILKETICTSEEIDSLSPEQEVFFYRLMVVCDDFGLMDARPAILKSRCYPLKSFDISCINPLLDALERAGLIFTYEVDGRKYLRITNWEKHQQIRAKRAKYPMPSDGQKSSDIKCNQAQANVPVIQSNPIQSNPNPIRIQSGAQKPRADYSEDFLHAWAKYPARPGANKQQSFKAWNARIKDGADPSAMIRGVERYAAYVKAMGISPEYIKQPATFFGPDRHYESDWTPTPQGNSYGNAKQSHTASLIAELTGANRQRESAVFVGTAERVD